MMERLSERIAKLPPEKRALLELKLRQLKSAGSAAPQIERRAPGDSAPLSFAQERIWFLDQLEPENSFYNLHTCVSLEGKLDPEALRRAIESVVSRHETLRTVYAASDGEPLQIVRSDEAFSLPILDLGDIPKAEVEKQALEILDREVNRPFDLSRDLMLRAKLLRLDASKHILALVTHHIASDGWSAGILIHEISHAYTSLCQRQKPAPAELPIQYRDFAIWQRERLGNELLEKQLGYWVKQLRGISPLQLPTDRVRPAVQSYRGGTESARFSKTLSDGLEALSRREGVTLFMTLLAAFQSLLCRYSAQEDIVIGSPIAGRVRPETEELIGVFINMLVLRTELSGNPTFREILRRVRSTTLAAYQHQELPFERLVEELQPTRDLSRNALFQVMFSYQNTPRRKFTCPGLIVQDVEIHRNSAGFDLSLYVASNADGIGVTLEYCSDLFDAGTIQRMLGHFETLLEGIVKTPDCRLSRLPLTTGAERHQLLVEWNRTEFPYENTRRIHDLFEAQVQRSPKAIAAAFDGTQLTYRELDARAEGLAGYLRKLGVGRESPVAISLERSLEMIVALLGVLKAGSAYIPLDPAYPQDRLAFILQDSQASMLLTQQSLLPSLPSTFAGHVLCVDRSWEGFDSPGPAAPSAVSPDDLAYIIYTSGSTGLPKGVQVTHRAVVNFLGAMQEQHRLTCKSALLAVTTLSFDIAGLELLLPLTTGARVELASHDEAMDGSQLIRKLDSTGITFMQATPVTWQLMLESGWKGNNRLTALCGGEALPVELANQLLPECASLWNMYGPTETTIWSTTHNVQASDKSISIGRPIHNTQIYILDTSLEPVPIGIPGELHIGGLGLARGYLHRAELTAERFIPSPFEPGERLYKTGDLARYLSDGKVELLGRMDHQVKIRGFRIELGEIETTLSQFPGIQQAVVVAREDFPGEKRLVAYVTSEPQSAPTAAELTSFLKTKLPEYMVPSSIAFLDEFPRTPNGKIDRRALPAPDLTQQTPEGAFVPARNHLERQIVHIWEKVLNVRPIGVTSNFFELGGYSLLAVRVMRQVEKVFNKKVPVTALFQHPTVEQLARFLKEESSLAPWSSLVPLQPKGSKVPFFWIHGELSDSVLPQFLGTDQPLYGLLHQGHDGKPARFTNVEDIATHYLSEIRTVQASGPYLIGGYCFGGLVAFEIAQQLRKQSEEVALLVLVAPSRLEDDKSLNIPLNESISVTREISRHMQEIRGLSAPGAFSYVFERARVRFDSAASPIRKFVQDKLCKACLGLGFTLPASLRSPYILKMYFKAIDDYRPDAYSGRVVIFRPTPAWRTLTTGNAEIREVQGSHTDILREPYVRAWAQELKMCLEQTQASRTAEGQITLA